MEVAELLSGVIALGAGALTSVALELAKRVAPIVDKIPVRGKQALVMVIAFGVVKVNALLGLALPVDALGWSADIVNTAITAGLAFGAYNVVKVS